MYKKQQVMREMFSLSNKELLNKVALLKKELFIARSDNKNSSNAREGFNVMNIRKMRKTVARALTVYNNRKDS